MSYLRTTSGRLITAAVGVALTGGGLAALSGGSAGVAIMCLSLLLTVLVGLFAAGLGTTDSPGAVVVIVATAPFAFFVYVLGLGLAIEHAPALGYLFGSLGLLALARGVLLTDRGPLAPAHVAAAPAR